MKYYSILRPISMGAIPNCVISQIVNFENRQYVEEIGRNAWGYFITEEILSRQQLKAQDLIDSEQAEKTFLLAKKVSKFASKVNDDLALQDVMDSFISGNADSIADYLKGYAKSLRKHEALVLYKEVRSIMQKKQIKVKTAMPILQKTKNRRNDYAVIRNLFRENEYQI